MRTLLTSACLVVAMALSCRAVAQAPPPKSSPDVIVYRGTYPGWPWVARTPGGRLLCVWREGTEHMYSATGRLMLSDSLDQGKSWSPGRVFHDAPEIDDRNVAILPLSDEEWIVCYNTYTQDAISRTMVLRTRDAGKTWSAPSLVCELDARTRSAPIRLASGVLLLPFYRAPGDQSLAALSSDAGATWEVVEIPNSGGFVGDEWDVCEVSEGRLVGIIRNNAPQGGGWFYKTESHDGGRTWTPVVKTNLRDSRSTSPAQIFLHNGRPVVLYADARMVSVAMAISEDPGLVEWKVEERLPCYVYRADQQPIADGSYPVSVPLEGNRRLIVDYHHDGGDHLITGHVVELPEDW